MLMARVEGRRLEGRVLRQREAVRGSDIVVRLVVDGAGEAREGDE